MGRKKSVKYFKRKKQVEKGKKVIGKKGWRPKGMLAFELHKGDPVKDEKKKGKRAAGKLAAANDDEASTSKPRKKVKKQRKYKGKGKMKFGLSDSDCAAEFMSSEGPTSDEDGASGHKHSSEFI